MDRRDHWDRIYASKSAGEVGWYRPHLEMSLELIRRAGAGKASAVIDIGGGLSALAGDLLEEGFEDVTVLDVSGEALRKCGQSLGERGRSIRWIEGDVTKVALEPLRYDLWHDRAVFHFLTYAGDRRAYAQAAERALRPGGHLVIATFSPTGPPKCSGLDVVRYDPESLRREFGERFSLVHAARERHITPSGAGQDYVYCLMEKTGDRISGDRK